RRRQNDHVQHKRRPQRRIGNYGSQKKTRATHEKSRRTPKAKQTRGPSKTRRRCQREDKKKTKERVGKGRQVKKNRHTNRKKTQEQAIMTQAHSNSPRTHLNEVFDVEIQTVEVGHLL